MLSVAIEQLEMLPGSQRTLGTILRAYHDPTRDFLREVAAQVDQVAIMTYDSGLPADWLFGIPAAASAASRSPARRSASAASRAACAAAMAAHVKTKNVETMGRIMVPSA